MKKKKSRKNILGFIAIGLIVLAVGVYLLIFYQAPQKDVVVPVVDIEPVLEENPVTAPLSGVGTLMDLAKRTDAVECQILYEASSISDRIEGTYFVSKGSVRGDFIIPAPELGGTIVTSTIINSTDGYVWSAINGELYGVQFKPDIQHVVDSRQPVPLDAEVRYICSPWVEVDQSIFVPPQNVTFQNQEAVIEAGMEYGTP